MPMVGSLGNRIAEFHHGKTFAKTKAKFGAKKANKQAIAAAMNSMRSEGTTIGEMYKSGKKKR